MIISQEQYEAGDKARLIALDAKYGFSSLNAPVNALVKLNKIRAQLYHRTQQGVVTVVANGRADWTGWFFLRQDNIARRPRTTRRG
jgi:hypothetical protein